MKKIVMGILFLVFQLIGFSDNLLGSWAIDDSDADYEIFTIFKMNDKYYKATKCENYVSIDELIKSNGKLYTQTYDQYIYSYDKTNKRLIERKTDEKDYYKTYSKAEDEDFSDYSLYIFDKDSKILKKTKENVKYNDFLGEYLSMQISKDDGKYCISYPSFGIMYDDFELIAKNKELYNENIKIYFSKATKSFIDTFKLKNVNVGDKILTVEYDNAYGNNGEFYYINKTNEDE